MTLRTLPIGLSYLRMTTLTTIGWMFTASTHHDIENGHTDSLWVHWEKSCASRPTAIPCPAYGTRCFPASRFQLTARHSQSSSRRWRGASRKSTAAPPRVLGRLSGRTPDSGIPASDEPNESAVADLLRELSVPDVVKKSLERWANIPRHVREAVESLLRGELEKIKDAQKRK